MGKSYDRISSHHVPVGQVAEDTDAQRAARLIVVTGALENIGYELKLEMFAHMHDPLVGLALAHWSDRIIDLAVFAHCGSVRPA